VAAFEEQAHFVFDRALDHRGHLGGIRHPYDWLEISKDSLFAPGNGRHVPRHRTNRRNHPDGGVAQVALGCLDRLPQRLAKGFMLIVGLPLICVLTFQLVKDMAVYEMGVAMTPASQMLEKAMDEDTKIAQLNDDLAAIQTKKVDRESKLAELAARKAKAIADLEDALKRNDESRSDAISLTDYQKKELSDVASREATIIQQFNADTEQINNSSPICAPAAKSKLAAPPSGTLKRLVLIMPIN